MKGIDNSMNKYIKNNLLNIYIIINIIYVFISSILFTYKIISYSMFGHTMIYAFFINLIISIILTIKRNKKYKFQIYDLLLILISIFLIISCIFAKNKDLALYGFIYRYEGLFAILYYLTLTYLSSFVSKDFKKIIAKVIVFTGIINTIYAFLQVNNSPLVLKIYNFNDIWATGFLNNPNFLGTYSLISLALSIGLFIDEKEKIDKIIYGISIAILMIGLLISNTTSCAVGLLVIFIYIFVYSLEKKKYKEILLIILIIISESIMFHKAGLTTLLKDLNTTKNEVSELSRGNYNENYGTKRVEIWRQTIEEVPKYLIHGIGIDNFSLIKNGRPVMVGYNAYDKAHNEYLQILITEGIFALISYLLLFGIILIKGIISSFKKNEIYLVLPVFAYLVQAFFNISVIEVAPIFYICLGLLIERKKY